MKVFHPLVLSIFLPTLGFTGPVSASSEATSFPSDQVIESRMDLGFLGIIGGGMNYRVGGKPISRLEDFQALIYPLHDEEASHLLYEAQECHFAASMMYVSGAAAGVDIALSFKPVPLLGVDWFDRITTGIVGSEIFWGLGALLDGSADGRKYNAVQRYNQLITQKDQAFLALKPQMTLAQGGAQLGLSCSF
jgi:hypothetical protein